MLNPNWEDRRYQAITLTNRITGVMAIFSPTDAHSGSPATFVIRVPRAAESNSLQAVEKHIDRSNATVPGNDKIGSRVSWRFAGSARYPSNPSGIT